MPQIIHDGQRYRVRLADGTVLRGRFHTADQANDARLRIIADRTLRALYPSQYSDFPSRDVHYRVPRCDDGA